MTRMQTHPGGAHTLIGVQESIPSRWMRTHCQAHSRAVFPSLGFFRCVEHGPCHCSAGFSLSEFSRCDFPSAEAQAGQTVAFGLAPLGCLRVGCTQDPAQTLRVMQEVQISHTRQGCASLLPPFQQELCCAAATLLPFKVLCSAQQSPSAELSPAQGVEQREQQFCKEGTPRGLPALLLGGHHCPSLCAHPTGAWCLLGVFWGFGLQLFPAVVSSFLRGVGCSKGIAGEEQGSLHVSPCSTSTGTIAVERANCP